MLTPEEKQLFDAVAFLKTLFNKDDFVWANDTFKQLTLAISQAEAFECYFQHESKHSLGDVKGGSYISINPSSGEGIAKGKNNVKYMRNFLIEFDSMPLEKQIPFMEASGIPYSTCVYSGGKSYHFIVSLAVPLTNPYDYKLWFEALSKKLGDLNDRACSDASRYTRFPFGIRHGKDQLVVKVNGRIDNKILEWIVFGQSFASYKTCLPTRPTSSASGQDRTKEIDNVDWYLKSMDQHFHLDMKTICPLCREEGRDRHGDNLQIGENGIVHCWADPDHGKFFHKHICALRIKSKKDSLIMV